MQADAVAWAEREARWHGVAAVITDLAHLVAQLALVEGVKDADALEDAERLSDMADAVTTDGRVADTPADPDVDGAFLGWHALGSVHLEAIACTVCGACYETDDEAAEIPACHDCGAPDTWENRQGVSFRALVAEIDGCPSLFELAGLGKRLYTFALPQDQAGVAWTRYALRKAALEAAVTLGAPARALVNEVEDAPARALGALGARLYRLQHGGAVAVAAVEWRKV